MRVQVSALILLISQPILAATEVGGYVSSTTWTAAGSPYRVTSTLTIPRGGSRSDPQDDIAAVT